MPFQKSHDSNRPLHRQAWSSSIRRRICTCHLLKRRQSSRRDCCRQFQRAVRTVVPLVEFEAAGKTRRSPVRRSFGSGTTCSTTYEMKMCEVRRSRPTLHCMSDNAAEGVKSSDDEECVCLQYALARAEELHHDASPADGTFGRAAGGMRWCRAAPGKKPGSRDRAFRVRQEASRRRQPSVVSTPIGLLAKAV